MFSIHLKTPELHHDVLRCIDGAVQFPILFELNHEGRTQMVACHKRPSEADAKQWVCSDYFASPWQPATVPRQALPVVLDMAALYETLLRTLIPLSPNSQEKLADLVLRLGKLNALQRDIQKTQAQLAKEKQFNRKVAINAQLRQLQNELTSLKD